RTNGAGETRVAATQMRDRSFRIERVTVGAVAALAAARPAGPDGDTFESQHTGLGVETTVGRETTELAAGGKHAMTRDHDRERIFAEGLTHRTRRARSTEARGDFPVRERRPRGDGAHGFVHAAMKGG